MALPPELSFGAHRLRLMTVSRNADDVRDARRCSDQALTAFCFVGEVLPDATGDGLSPIAWYYSPLYQFERKKIRVEASVIADALSKAVAQRVEEAASEPARRPVFVDTASVCSSPAVLPGEEDKAAAAEDGEEGVGYGRRTQLPALFIRLGTSTTFREYKLVEAEPAAAAEAPKTPAAPSAAEDEETSSFTEREDSTSGAEVRPHLPPPPLRPTLPRRPSLKLFSSRFGSFAVRRLPLRRDGVNNFMAAAAATSAPQLQDEAMTAVAADHVGLNTFAALPVTLNDVEALFGDAECEAQSITSTSSAPVATRSPNVLSVLHAADTPVCHTPNSRSRKGALNGPSGSSLSSAFLSSSNCPSGRVSRLPTGALSAARSPMTEADVRPTSAGGPVGGSVRNSVDVPFTLREPLSVSSAASTPNAQSPSFPSPPSSQRIRTPRRPQLYTRSMRPLCEQGGHRGGAWDLPRGSEAVTSDPAPALHAS